MGALLCYAWHQRATEESSRLLPWAGPTLWLVGGGLSLGVSLLALGGFGLVVIPVVILHQVYLRSGSTSAAVSSSRTKFRWTKWLRTSILTHGLLAVAIAFLVALPWHMRMVVTHGWEALAGLGFQSWGMGGTDGSLLFRLFELAPVTLPLGIYGAARAIRLALIDENNTPETMGGSLWVIWLAVAALAPSFWTGGPRSALEFFLLVPLDLLAALTVADLVNRRVPARTLIILAPATAMSVAWWASEDLQGAVDDLLHGRASAGTALGLHLALDLILLSIWFTRGLDRWARRRDDRQRCVLACFLVTVLVITVAAGVREVVFRHSETYDLLTLRTMILRRNRERPFEQLAVIGPAPVTLRTSSTAASGQPLGEQFTGGWLRFILRTALPNLPQRDLNNVDELLLLPEGQRLIIFTGSGQRLSTVTKSKLGLEIIHPGRQGILDAYATAHNRPPRR
jgi:hypothetical protein